MAQAGAGWETGGGGFWVLGRRLWKDKVQWDPWGLFQDGLGHGDWTRKTRTELLMVPSLSPQGCPHLCPRCSNSNSVGAGGYQIPELQAPSAELPEFLLLQRSLPAPLELVGR